MGYTGSSPSVSSTAPATGCSPLGPAREPGPPPPTQQRDENLLATMRWGMLLYELKAQLKVLAKLNGRLRYF